MRRLGVEPVGSTAASFAEFRRAEIDQCGRVIRVAGIRADTPPLEGQRHRREPARRWRRGWHRAGRRHQTRRADLAAAHADHIGRQPPVGAQARLRREARLHPDHPAGQHAAGTTGQRRQQGHDRCPVDRAHRGQAWRAGLWQQRQRHFAAVDCGNVPERHQCHRMACAL